MCVVPSDPSRSRVMTLEAIRYRAGSLQILNQLLLPQETVFDEVRTVQDGYEAIKSMKARNITHSVFFLFRFLSYSTLTTYHLPVCVSS